MAPNAYLHPPIQQVVGDAHESAMENPGLVSWGLNWLQDANTLREQREAQNSINVHEAGHAYFGDSLVVGGWVCHTCVYTLGGEEGRKGISPLVCLRWLRCIIDPNLHLHNTDQALRARVAQGIVGHVHRDVLAGVCGGGGHVPLPGTFSVGRFSVCICVCMYRLEICVGRFCMRFVCVYIDWSASQSHTGRPPAIYTTARSPFYSILTNLSIHHSTMTRVTDP
jgi:hypothetical protein